MPDSTLSEIPRGAPSLFREPGAHLIEALNRPDAERDGGPGVTATVGSTLDPARA